MKKLELTEEQFKKLKWIYTVLGKILNEKDPEKEMHSEIVKVMEVFSKVNPAIKRMYGNKSQRTATVRLIKEFGIERVMDAAKLAVACYEKEHAPSVTTPYELETKWAKLKAYYTRKKEEDKSSKSETLDLTKK